MKINIRTLSAASVALLALCTGPLGATAAAHSAVPSLSPTLAGRALPIPAVSSAAEAAGLPDPLPTSQCLTQLGIHCYSPLQYRVAYDLNPLYQREVTGKGRTIVIVDSFGSPTIQHDLDVFDAQWGLPDATVHIVQAGTIPPFDVTNPDDLGWAAESTLDVEYAHAVAPGAKIVLVETPVSETVGVTGFPEMMRAEKKLIDAGVPDVISQSFGTAEATFPGVPQGDDSSLLALRYAFKDAAAHHVTVLAATGDTGAAAIGSDETTPYPNPAIIWPASDPLVTAVGGTMLNLNDAGQRLAPDAVWNDVHGAGGGGLSSVFDRPAFQNPVRAVVGTLRGIPDISMSAAHDGGAWVYYSYNPAAAGWHVFSGTSEATPLFAGIVALADQVAGHRLGDINQALYALGTARADRSGIVDVTTGDNTFDGVTGYSATPGYDLASGLGTIDAARFVPALARAAER